jgi:geranylgeranyl reductase family protein
MQHMWDVVVVGSGPAGSAAAIGALAADPSAAVLMLDRSEHPRDKCCGDAVLDAVFDDLAAVGVARERIVADRESVDTLRIVSPRGTEVLGIAPVPITIVPRAELDARLCAAACTAGARWRRHMVREVVDHGTHVEIDGQIRTRVLIGADGAESVVRRTVAGNRRRDLAVAIRGIDHAAGDAVPTVILDGRPGLAYAWRFPYSQDGANVGYGHLLKPGESVSRSALLHALERMLPGRQLDPRSLRAHRLPLSTSRPVAARGRILLTGDAASLINPVSGEGIYYAVASGLAAGDAAAPGRSRPAAHYRAALRRRFARHHRHVGLLSDVTRNGAILEAGVRAARADHRAFEDLARIGLGDGLLTPRLLLGMGTALARGDRERTALRIAVDQR